MILSEIVTGVTGLTEWEQIGADQIQVTIHLENSSEPLKCELTLEEFGFADFKEMRLVLTSEIKTNSEVIKDFIENSNPFVDPWFEEQNARLSLHEEFISITLPPAPDAAVLNYAIRKIGEIRDHFRR